MRVLIEGILKSNKLYISELFIDEYPCHIQIKCLIFVPRSVYTMKKVRIVLCSVISLLKSIITLKSNKNVSFKLGILPNVCASSVLLCDYVKRRIMYNPFKYNAIISKVLKRMKVFHGYKVNYGSSRNKVKNRR